MVDAGELKIFMSTRDTVIRAYMAGAILALAAVFAVTINVQTGVPIVGAALFPVGFCMLYLLGFDLLTGVFVLCPLAPIDKRPGVTRAGVLRNWGLVFIGHFAGAFTVALMMSIVFTFGFTTDPDKVGQAVELPLPPLLEPRMVFDGYVIQRQIHASSHSHIYLVRDIDTNDVVTIEIPSIDLRGNADYLRRFMMEEWVPPHRQPARDEALPALQEAKLPQHRRGVYRGANGDPMDDRQSQARSGNREKHH